MFTNSRLMLSLIAVVSLLTTTDESLAQVSNYSDEQLQFFEKNIRPAFAKYCYECHSVESGTTRGGLLVDTREGLLTGGDSGAAINPGSFEENLLWEAINWDSYEMPPSQKMPDEVIAHFKTWIKMGAPDPRVRERVEFKTKMTPAVIEEGKQHWAFQSPKRSAGSEIDEFIAGRLKSEGLKPVKPADSLTLLRRLNFDLIGLPPTLKEIRAFDSAWKRNRNRAIQSKVDELQKRSQFGERWGRHWLDVARYADTSGNINVAYPQAWRYRDYVIEAFNKDTPYDRFIQEQIAGDLLPVKTDEKWQENLIATGFLAVGMKRHDERNPKKFTMDMVDEQIDTMTQSILGITVACARCHDHKSDPIPTSDYYSLAGIFLSTQTLYGTVWGQQNHRPSDLLLLPILDKNSGYNGPSSVQLKKQIAEQQSEVRRMAAAARESGERVQRDFVSIRNRIAKLEGILATLNEDGTQKTFGMGVQEGSKFVNASILINGEVERPAQEVPRGFLQVLNGVSAPSIAKDSSGRRELAEFLTSKDNPLTARVMANRVWMQLFGRPIVESPNNWGPTGIEPTHPELLDHLAIRFMDNDWSVKSLIREIVLSDAYQRSSTFVTSNSNVDPDNKFLWRMSPRQLDAEVMRDAMLAAGGNLDLSRPKSSVAEWGDGRVDRGPQSEARIHEINNYRSVYLPVIRDTVNEALELFGFPDPNMTSAGRRASIVPTQALYVMNGDFAIQQSGQMADAMLAASSDPAEQVQWAFLTAYGRPATTNELQASVKFIRSMASAKVATTTSPEASGPQGRRRRDREQNGRPANSGRPGMRRRPNGTGPGQGQASSSPERNALMLFCQTLMASADFRILN